MLLLFCFLIDEERIRIRMPRDVIFASATFIDHVHGVTYTKCQTQNGSTHGSVFATFRYLFLIN